MLTKDGEPTPNVLRGPRKTGGHNHERTIQASLNTTYSPLNAGLFDTLLVHIVLHLSRFIS
jgi:hypothetical protein